MRRLNRAGGTGRAGGDRESLEIERYDQRLAFDVAETNIGRSGNAGRIAAIDYAPVNFAEHGLLQTIAQLFQPRYFAIFEGRNSNLGCFAEADNRGNIFRAGAALALVAAAKKHGLDERALPHIQCANALRGMHLVTGDREQIATDFRHINRQLARGLHRVGVKVNIGLRGDAADLHYRLRHAGFIVGHHDADELGVGAEGALNVGGIDSSRAIHRHECHFHAVALKLMAGIEHGMVLDSRSDNVIAGGSDAKNRQIICLSPAAGKNDFRRPAIQQCGHTFARAFYRGPGMLPLLMYGRGVAKPLRIVRTHGLQHFRQERRGGVIV